MKNILILIFALLATLETLSQSLDSVFQALNSNKQVYDKIVDRKATTKGLYYFDCNEHDGCNKLIGLNTIIGSKLKVCDDGKVFFFYIYSIDSKELHILTTYPYDEDSSNSFKLAIKSITDIYILDSLGRLKYYFLIPVVEPQHYQLKRFPLKDDYFQCKKAKSVIVLSMDSIICKPNPCKSYFKNDRPIYEFHLKEYLDMIDILKKEVDSEIPIE
jgi:hypothetical protein